MRMTFGLPIFVSEVCFSLGLVLAMPTAQADSSSAPVRIDCGGGVYTDSLGQVWAADNSFVGGSVKSYPSSKFVAGTEDDKLFQSERFGRTLVYQIPMANGAYDVTLNFAEMYWSAAGKRVFSLSLEGQTVIQDLDIWATVGQYAALQRTFAVTVADGVLDIVGNASIDNAQLAAIEVKPSADPTPTPTPTPASFRIAISSDGNWHDWDDICSTAMSIAELAATGNQTRLVHYDYADHYWITNSSREELMRVSAVETAKLWGGFNLSVFYNSTQLRSLAVSHLAAEINKSTAIDQLRILGVGPMQVIGLAVAQSDPRKRQYVTLVSHSIWNDTHATNSGPREGLSGPAYSYSKIGGMGVQLLHIIDQNAGIDKPYNQYYWLRDSTNPKLRWLWDRGQAAGKSTFDCSDAGETYFILTGDQNCTPLKLKALLTGVPN
jgi:Malectin domain